jgi:hypothetical protein
MALAKALRENWRMTTLSSMMVQHFGVKIPRRMDPFMPATVTKPVPDWQASARSMASAIKNWDNRVRPKRGPKRGPKR